MTNIPKLSSRSARLLLIGCSSLALCVPAAANDVIFSSSDVRPVTGQRTTQSGGVTQIALTGGGTVSISGAAEYTINADGSIDLHSGSITVSGDDAGAVVVRMPEGLEGRVDGSGSSSTFSVAEDGSASGHTLSGEVRVGQKGRAMRPWAEGMMWNAKPGRGPRRSMANNAVSQPDAAPATSPEPPQVAAISDDAGPVGAATNGIPVTLGDGLAAAGASSDIIDAGRRVEAAVGNPLIETFPSGDLALLVAAAAQLEAAYGGAPFNAAQADIIRTYLRFLANGGAGADFLAAYSGFALGYLDLIRAGGVPSGFASGVATAADIDAYLAFIARTGAISDLAARDRALADAYLAFLASGGNRDAFAASFTDLTEAYFAFIRAGGVPTEFTGASQVALAESIAFLQDSGLVAQLSAADQALVAAFLANGGIAFAAQFETALDDYFAFLASGQLPSAYTVLDQATLRAYLETLSDTGLLETVLADQAGFYADYLAFLRAGGDIDAFAGLPANIFAGYAAQLDSYFAFLAAGNLPSQFTASDAAQLQAFILELQAAGALDRFVGADQAAFFASFSQFVAGGGAFDAFAGLNANIFAGYAVDLQAYFDFLSNGGIPSAYTVLSQDTIEEYLAALEAADATGRFLDDLTEFYQAYFQFVLGGGNPDNFAGLPVPPDFPAFAAALNTYAAFLNANGLPSDYTEEDIAQLQAFFNSVLESGQVNDLLGANAALLNAYFAFLNNGGGIDEFAGLPVLADYVVQLNAYFAFLDGGGFPADYTVLDQATLNAYLAALTAAQGGLAGFGDLNAFFADYAAFVLNGGDPVNFAGLPVYAQYVAALNAYFDFLAAGNLPSEYTVVDLATLEDFLEALAALQGGLAGIADLNDFFVDYFAFIQSGNDPDQFAGLPGNTGGGDNGGNGPQFTYTGGFNSDQPLNIFATTDNAVTQRFGDEGTVDDDGRLVTPVVTPVTATATDIGGDNAVVVGRYENGTVNQFNNTVDTPLNGGIAYAVVEPFSGNVPTMGTIDYEILAATRPVYSDGATAPGTFEADFAIAFDTFRYSLDGQIIMPDATYQVLSGGDGSFVDINGGATFLQLRPFPDWNGRACLDGNCQLVMNGSLAGPGDADRAGFVYRSFDPGGSTPQQQEVLGAVAFAAVDTDTGNDAGITHPDTLVYAGGFDASGDVLSLVRVGGFEAFGLHTPEINAAGELDRTTDGWFATPGDGSYFDVQGDAKGLIGRFGGGRVNLDGRAFFGTPLDAGAHYILLAPFTGTLPTGLMIEYDLLAATRPTFSDGAFGPGSFEGTLTVDYQSSFINSNFAGSVEMMEENGPEIYEFAVQVVERDLMDWVMEGSQGFSTDVTGSGRACPAGSACQIKVILGGGGQDGVERVGVAYEVTDVNVGISIEGAALFGQPGTSGGAGGNNSGNIGGTGFTGTRENQTYYNYSGGTLVTAFGGSATFVDGEVTGFESGLGTVSSNDTTIVEAGDLESIAWARWTDGAVQVDGIFGPSEVVVGPNDGYHVFTGSITETLPSGTIAYELVGGTSPTDNAGSAPGSLTGDLAIAFGSVSKVGFDLTMDVGGRSWGVSTQGGAANPQDSDTNLVRSSGIWTFNSAFNSVLENVAATGGACAATCNVSVGGTLYGADADYVGLAMNVTDFDGTLVRGVSGVAIFGQEGATTSVANQARSAASIAPSTAPIASLDWSRWTGAAGASPQAIDTARAQAALDPVAAMRRGGEGGGAQPAPLVSRDWAVEQAERLMGGSITWPGASRANPR